MTRSPVSFTMLLYSIYLLVLVACSDQPTSATTTTPPVNISNPCDSIPALNQQIASFVSDHIKKKVGRGECWDLAAEPLRLHQATWDGRFTYGKLIDYKTDCVFPGDILQFDKVMIETVHATGRLTEEMAQHTAIVYEVKGTGDFTIAHQNYNNTRKVILTPLNMANVKRGSIKIYRPYR